MQDKQPNLIQENENQRRPIKVDRLLFVLLLVGWLFIFLFATLGSNRSNKGWLPVNPVIRAAANYSVDSQDTLRLAQVNPEIIDAVKQDEKNREALKTPSPEPNRLEITPTATPNPLESPTVVRSLLTVNSGGPYEGEEGSEISLVVNDFDSFLDIIPGGVSYLWDLDGDGLYDDADGPTAVVTFLDEGEYPIGVKAVDLIGREAVDTTVANVINVAPTIEIGRNVYTDEGQTTFFAATATDPGRDILFYQWDFGDGQVGVNNSLRPQHVYEDDGEYLVTLRVRDNDGGQSQATLIAYVDNLPPDVNAGLDRTVDEGSPITFRGRATDPAEDNDTLSYAWDLEYDGYNFSPDVRGQRITTTYTDGPADILVALAVEDEDDGRTVDTLKVTVNNVPPVITNVSNNGPVGEGSFLNITVSATDVGNDTLTYAFDWNNDGNYDNIQQSNSAGNIWPDQGQHTVAIRVDDGDGDEVFFSTIVSTFNLTPTAVAQTAQQTYFEGSTVSFNGSDSNDPGVNDTLTYAWNFGDGSTSSGVNATHTYDDNGVYSATLTVSDNSGATDSDSLTVTILNANPQGDAGTDRTINEGQNIELIVTASEATDPGDDTLTYAWDFNNDGLFETPGRTASYIYPKLDGPEEKIVKLRIRDDDYPASTSNGGQIGEFVDTFKLIVNNIPPTNVDAGGPYKGDINEQIRLTAQIATDIPDDPLTYEWDFNYDGNNFDRDGIGRVITNTWNSANFYSVALRVSDGDGGQTIDTTTVDINAVPVAEAGGPYFKFEGTPVVLDGRASHDSDGDKLTFTWNFGDGSPAKTGITTTHLYADDGTYTARLTVRDSDGALSTDDATVNILNANPTASIVPNRDPLQEGQNVVLGVSAGNVSDPGPNDTITTFEWDFEYDGSTFNVDASGSSASHTYASLDGPDDRTVALRIRDNDYPAPTDNGGQNGEFITTLELDVDNVPPANVDTGGPYKVIVTEPITLTAKVATDVPGDALVYAWDYSYNSGDGFQADVIGRAFSYTWNSTGLYTVALRVSDDDGGQTIVATTVNVNAVPVADAGGPYLDLEGTPIIFDGTASYDDDGDQLTFTWNFGDGSSPKNGITTTHSYADDGIYTTTLTVRDSDGDQDTAAATVEVLNANPFANIVPNSNPIEEGQDVVLKVVTGNASDPGTDDTLTFEWDFEYDGITFTPQAVSQSASYTYTQLDGPEQKTVALRIRDDDYPAPTAKGGQIGEFITTLQLTVDNVPPANVDAGGPYKIIVNQPLTLTAQIATDIPVDTLVYAWDFDYNTPIPFQNEGTGRVTNHIWNTTGLYTIALRVSDEDGGVTFDTTSVNVNAVPVADAGGPYLDFEGSQILFEGSGSIDPDGDDLIYTWNFGDGTAVQTGITTTHIFTDNGIYTTTLTVQDSDGDQDTANVAVNILNANPIISLLNNQIVDEGQLLNLSGMVSDPGAGDVSTLSYAWDFDYDGVTFNVDATGSSVTTSYASGPATYTAALRIRDDDYPYPPINGGQIGQAISTFQVQVNNINPTVDAGGPYYSNAGQQLTLTGTGNDVSADTLTYIWDLDNNGTFETPGATITNTWLVSGIYTVTLRVTDNDGGIGADTTQVTINAIPVVDAGGPYTSNEGIPIIFDGSGSFDPDNTVLTYTWDFGDSSPIFTSTNPTVTHIYFDNDSYTTTLTVDDGRGGLASDQANVTVTNAPPTVVIGGPYSGNEKQMITFDGSGSFDIGINDTLSYTWNLGDGSPLATGPTVDHVYDDNGTYTVTLTVSDDDGGLSTATTNPVVINLNPTADAGGPYQTIINVSIPLTGTGSDVADPITFEWDLDNDGIFETPGQNVTNSWATPGLITVALKVADDDGGFSIDTTTVDVNSPPVANAGGPYTADENVAVVFDGSASSDADGDPLTYTWDFGDGSPLATGLTANHTYTDNGIYTATLTVDDGRGGVSTDQTNVTINNVAPTVNIGGPYSVDEGQNVDFDGSGSNDQSPDDNPLLTYGWDFGDGTTGAGATISHQYDDNGTFTATLTVTDKDGAATSASTTVNIANLPPTANSGGPYTTTINTPVTLSGSGTDIPADPLTFDWDLDSDSNFETPGQSVNFTRSTTGTYTVVLRVSDDDGAATTASTTVEVNSVLPLTWLTLPFILAKRRNRKKYCYVNKNKFL